MSILEQIKCRLEPEPGKAKAAALPWWLHAGSVSSSRQELKETRRPGANTSKVRILCTNVQTGGIPPECGIIPVLFPGLQHHNWLKLIKSTKRKLPHLPPLCQHQRLCGWVRSQGSSSQQLLGSGKQPGRKTNKPTKKIKRWAVCSFSSAATGAVGARGRIRLSSVQKESSAYRTTLLSLTFLRGGKSCLGASHTLRAFLSPSIGYM